MTHTDKVRAAVEDLTARGVWRSTAAPPIYRLLWRFGVAVPPPLFQTFLALTTLHGAFFGLIMGTCYGFIFLYSIPNFGRLDEAIAATVGVSVVAGLFFGLCMATYYRRYARRLGLPTWTNYIPGQLAETNEEEADW